MVNMVRGQPSRSRFIGLETWDGWLIAGNTQDIFVIQSKLILHGYIHFETTSLVFKSFHTFFQHNKRIFAATGEYFK